MGDFNHCSLDKTLCNFDQYVSCHTRKNKTLDQCYGSLKDAYKSVPLPPLGSADHCCVHLIPTYRTTLQRGKVSTRVTRVWSEEAVSTLQGCPRSTAWDVFQESSSDIDQLTDVVSSWISYCEDIVIPVKTVKIDPNCKPWVGKHLKMLLNKKKLLFRTGNLLELQSVQKEIKQEIWRSKLFYKQLLEKKLSNNNLGCVWDSLKIMTGQDNKTRKKVALEGFTSDQALANGLNDFYCRFDVCDYSNERVIVKKSLSDGSDSVSLFNVHDVTHSFTYCKTRTSGGPKQPCAHPLCRTAGPHFHTYF